MVERRMELKRRYHRKAKMRKLKLKLVTAKSGGEREAILRKIHILSPWWTEASLTNTPQAASTAPKAPPSEKKKAPPPRPKKEKA